MTISLFPIRPIPRAAFLRAAFLRASVLRALCVAALLSAAPVSLWAQEHTPQDTDEIAPSRAQTVPLTELAQEIERAGQLISQQGQPDEQHTRFSLDNCHLTITHKRKWDPQDSVRRVIWQDDINLAVPITFEGTTMESPNPIAGQPPLKELGYLSYEIKPPSHLERIVPNWKNPEPPHLRPGPLLGPTDGSIIVARTRGGTLIVHPDIDGHMPYLAALLTRYREHFCVFVG